MLTTEEMDIMDYGVRAKINATMIKEFIKRIRELDTYNILEYKPTKSYLDYNIQSAIMEFQNTMNDIESQYLLLNNGDE